MSEQPEGINYSRDGAPPSPGDGSDPSLEVWEFLYEVRQRWWLVLGCALLATGAAWFGMKDQEPVYTAEALLRQSDEPGAVPGLGGVRTRVERVDFGSQVEMIRSRSVLRPVVEGLGLQLRTRNRSGERSKIFSTIEIDADVSRGAFLLRASAKGALLLRAASEATISRASAQEWLVGPGFRVRVSREVVAAGDPVRFYVVDRPHAVESLEHRIRTDQGKGTGVRLRYTDPDPRLAAAVVNEVAQSFREFRLRAAREAAARRKTFLGSQLVELADSLRRTEEQFLRYQEQQGLLNPEAEEGALVKALTEAENELRSLRSRESQLEGLLAAAREGDDNSPNPSRILAMGRELLPGGSDLYTQLRELEADRRRLTASRFGYTETNPEVQVIDSLIAATYEELQVLTEESLQITQNSRREAEQRLHELREEVGGTPERSAQFARLQQRVDAVQEVYDLLVEKYYEAQISEAAETGDVEIVDLATVPTSPDPLHRRRNLVLALAVGAMVGIGGLAGRRYLDRSVQSIEEAARITDLPILAVIPKIDSEEDPAGVEAFRSLVTQFTYKEGRESRIIAVTSAVPKEGKTTIASNLALYLVEQGLGVILVDTDLRRPTVHKVFDVEADPGLSDVVDGSLALERAVHATEGAGLHLLTCGSKTDNPPALLSDDRFGRFLDAAAATYDIVVLDTPPVLPVADTSLLCRRADGVILTVLANKTDRTALGQAVYQVRRVEGQLIGLVVNSVPTSGTYSRYQYGYYEYSSYYLDDGDRHRNRRRKKRRRTTEGSSRRVVRSER